MEFIGSAMLEAAKSDKSRQIYGLILIGRSGMASLVIRRKGCRLGLPSPRIDADVMR
jgi:hypothetical protein